VRDSNDLRAESAPRTPHPFRPVAIEPRREAWWERAFFLPRRRVSLRLRRYKLSCINNHDVTHGYTLHLLWIDRRTHKLCAMHSKVGVPRRKQNACGAPRRRILMELNQGVKLGSGARAGNQRCVCKRELIWNKRRDNTFGFVENRKRSSTLTVARNHSKF
jgi:hypothetical protein